MFCDYCVICDDCEVVCCVSGDDAVVHGWNDSFWEEAGLGDLVAEGYRRIGLKVLAPGKAIGNGLIQKSADEMGLRPGTAIATSLIDAHAGGVGILYTYFIVPVVLCMTYTCTLGMLGADIDEVGGQSPCHVTSRLALIGGTSTCHMTVSNNTHGTVYTSRQLPPCPYHICNYHLPVWMSELKELLLFG